MKSELDLAKGRLVKQSESLTVISSILTGDLDPVSRGFFTNKAARVARSISETRAVVSLLSGPATTQVEIPGLGKPKR